MYWKCHLYVPLVEVDRDDRVRVQVVARANRAVKIRRGIADDEKRRVRLAVDRRRHPHPAAERLKEVAALVGQHLLFGRDVAVHVAARRVVDRPHPFLTLVGDRVERPQQVAVGGAVRLQETPDAVLAAIRADQHLAVDDRGRHRFRVALFGVGDLLFPQDLAGLRVERHQLRVDRAHEQPAALDRDAAIVVAAAHGDDRAELVLVVPELLARRRVDRVEMVERRRQIHDAVDDDGRGFHRFQHRGLEHERGLQLADVAGGDLGSGVVARLVVAAVGMDPVLRVTRRGVERGLRDVGAGCQSLSRRRRSTGNFLRQSDPATDERRTRDGGRARQHSSALHRSPVTFEFVSPSAARANDSINKATSPYRAL